MKLEDEIEKINLEHSKEGIFYSGCNFSLENNKIGISYHDCNDCIYKNVCEIKMSKIAWKWNKELDEENTVKFNSMIIKYKRRWR
jgi:hypothetical protein